MFSGKGNETILALNDVKIWQLLWLSGSVCANNPVAKGSNPKYNICALLSFFLVLIDTTLVIVV